MSTPIQLPDSGRYTDEEWVKYFGGEPKTFRQNCVKHGIPFVRFGNRIIVRAEALHEALENGQKTPDKAKGKRGRVDLQKGGRNVARRGVVPPS